MFNNVLVAFAMLLPVSILLTLALLQIKHLLFDFVFQPPFEYENKGTYLHFGGIRHAGKNALGTGFCFVLGFFGNLTWPIVIGVVIADFLVHYHVDYAKVRINRACGLDPKEHARFWWLLGLDQCLHHLTYLALIVGVVAVQFL